MCGSLCKDSIGYVGGIFLALCTLPQIMHMWRTRRADDLQKRFLLLYLGGNILTLVYLLRKDAWATWATIVVEVVLTCIALFMKIFLDARTAQKQNGNVSTVADVEQPQHQDCLTCEPYDCGDCTKSKAISCNAGVGEAAFNRTANHHSESSSDDCASDQGSCIRHKLLNYEVAPHADLQDVTEAISATIKCALKANTRFFLHSMCEVFCKDEKLPRTSDFKIEFILDESSIFVHCSAQLRIVVINLMSSGETSVCDLDSMSNMVQDELLRGVPMCMFLGDSSFSFDPEILSFRS